MSAEENRKLVQICYEAFSRGNMATVFEALSDDVVWTNHSPAACPYNGVYYGKGGVEDFLSDLSAIELEKFDVRHILAEDETVVVLLDDRYTMKSTGKSSEGPLVHVLTLNDGKIASFDEFEHCSNAAWA
jgi:ketosteroid isomerase-like protein